MAAENDFCIAVVTAPNVTVARKIATAALKEKLAACANIIPKIESHYLWQGQLESSSEAFMLLKTMKGLLPALEQCVVRNHPYDTPEFVVFRLDEGNKKYLDWIASSVQPPVAG